MEPGFAQIAEEPLWWWYANRHKYPWLYPAACRALTAMATSIKSEQVWSQGGRIATAQRSRIQVQTLRQLLLLQQEAILPDVKGMAAEEVKSFSRRVMAQQAGAAAQSA